MPSKRLVQPWGSRIERAQALQFSFNGRPIDAYAGDTVASALLANGVKLVGRSYKLHRPRGIFSCGPEEPTGIADVGSGSVRTPNTRLTEVQARNGLEVSSGNCWPSLRHDILAGLGLFSSYMPAGFYYKTFTWPRWEWFEPAIRRLAAASRASDLADPDSYGEVSTTADVLVIGGGLAGVRAALSAAQSGKDVLMIDGDVEPGGSLTSHGQGLASMTSIQSMLAAFKQAGGRLSVRTTALGAYDQRLITAVQTGGPGSTTRERLIKIRADQVIIATGAFDRPMLFPDNDRPGVMLAGAVERYASLYGVACGERVVIAAACDAAYGVASTLALTGIEVVAIVDCREEQLIGAENMPEHAAWYPNSTIVAVHGSADGVTGVTIADMPRGQLKKIPCDNIASAGGATPNVSLYTQFGGTLRWLEESSMFVPDRRLACVATVGACAGIFDVDQILTHADAMGRFGVSGAPEPIAGGTGFVPADNRPSKAALAMYGRRPGKQFVDLQNDVDARDIQIAALENYRSVEHLKRYTTTGMATDQGKTSNVNAIVLMGQATGRLPQQVGTTRFRAPYRPVTLNTISAGRSGMRLRPLRLLQARDFHAERGALFEEFSAWERPAAYLQAGEDLHAAALREAAHVRRGVALFDGSPLGKIEIYGPDAADFLDLMFVGQMSTMPLGVARYGVRLNENGVIVDDGIVSRLGRDHFWVNTTSGGAEQAALVFEEWLQCEYPHLQVLICPVTAQWGNVTVSGPMAWKLLNSIGFDDAFAPEHMQHMTMMEGSLRGTRVRVLRASFSGELGYEINLPASETSNLFSELWQSGRALQVGMYGVEALMILRTEKGFIHVGADTDGTSLPQDVGLWRGMTKKKANFVGRRSLLRPAGLDTSRLRLVGIKPGDRATAVAVGSILKTLGRGDLPQGHVTSSYFSPALGEPIALALLAGGADRLGERLQAWSFGRCVEVEVVETPFYDAKGERIHGR
ncbi:2Fe-2S iron-sulfur cluster-binding protein [Bordetella sp. BOR01]|uniref:2Fe-2S iron-sulfur cluster-binding protein n=1 Tax=Bordetella sp. BOR01 TaxID=2854779 RepID=UPI001C459D23|nr:2Fe-2S iron-sulfur cluster-binding protein [Bordetella sp. BOR01]MBV7482223.1 (2Fe-2S)-binding protein [Bordetella sp. BOR01]